MSTGECPLYGTCYTKGHTRPLPWVDSRVADVVELEPYDD